MIRIFLLFIFGCLFLSSCNVINPAEKTPTYVRVDSFQFINAAPAKTGSISHKITSVWAFFNNQPIGVFDLPATIPVLADEPGQILIVPGINLSGFTSYQTRYDFYTADTFSFSPAPGQVLQHNFITKYADIARFPWIENFDVGSPFIKVDEFNLQDTGMTKTTDASKIFEGSGAGYIQLTSSKPSSESINNTDIVITRGQAAYLEINYKCSVDFTVGLQTTLSSGLIQYEYIVGLKATNTWNKVYIGLKDFMDTYNTLKYRVMVKATLPSGQSDGYVLLDNFKIVCY